MTCSVKPLAAGFLFLGCLAWSPAALPAEKPAVRFEVRRAETKPAGGLTEATVAGTKNKVYLHKEAALTGQDIAGARAVVDERDRPAVEVTFTAEGRKKMARLTGEHQGKPLAILVDGKVIAAPVVRATISGGKAVITGHFTKEEAARIVKGIRGK